MYDFSTSFVLFIWIYGNKNDDDDEASIRLARLRTCRKQSEGISGRTLYPETAEYEAGTYPIDTWHSIKQKSDSTATRGHVFTTKYYQRPRVSNQDSEFETPPWRNFSFEVNLSRTLSVYKKGW
jgi:hypothetical protein